MKLVYRITTPILAVGAIALGIFLDMFNFVIGSKDSQIDNLVSTITNVAQNLGYNLNKAYGFSVYKLLGMLGQSKPADDSQSFIEIIKPIMPQLIAFLVIMFIIVGVLIALAVCAAAIADKKKRSKMVYILSASGLVLMFINILITNNAFDHIINGDINITQLVKLFSESTIAALATAILSVTNATLSAGFYAMFGMFILIIIWTIVAGYVISSPIVPTKKAYKRKKPIRNPFVAAKAKKK